MSESTEPKPPGDKPGAAPPKKRGRPARTLKVWGIDEHDKFQMMYRSMHVGYNKHDRDEVDKWAEALIAFVNKARGF